MLLNYCERLHSKGGVYKTRRKKKTTKQNNETVTVITEYFTYNERQVHRPIFCGRPPPPPRFVKSFPLHEGDGCLLIRLHLQLASLRPRCNLSEVCLNISRLVDNVTTIRINERVDDLLRRRRRSAEVTSATEKKTKTSRSDDGDVMLSFRTYCRRVMRSNHFWHLRHVRPPSL